MSDEGRPICRRCKEFADVMGGCQCYDFEPPNVEEDEEEEVHE